MVDGKLREMVVGAEGAGALGFPFGEGWRVEDDEVKLALHISAQPVEGIGLHEFVRTRRYRRGG